MQHKTFPCQIKAIDDSQGSIIAYASTFGNVDQQNDRVIKGAFKKSIQDALARGKAFLWPMLYQHSADLPIGGWHSASEDDKGLRVKGQINLDIQLGREVYSNIKAGILDQFSIGYDVPKGGYNYTKDGVRELSALSLWEISPVVFAADPEALLVGVKNMRGNTMGHGTFNEHYARNRARKAGRTFDDSTWTSIDTHMAEILAELGKTEPDITKIRSSAFALDGWFHQSPGTTAQDLAQTIGTQAGSSQLYAGYDQFGNPKSRVSRARREIEWSAAKLAALLSDEGRWKEAEKKLSPLDRSISQSQRTHLRNNILGIKEPVDKTDAELQAQFNASPASKMTQAGRDARFIKAR
jgi:HK97 family phage prohead protease